jgi:hypothetical protein
MDQHMPGDMQPSGDASPEKNAEPQAVKLSPELLEWFRQQIDMEDMIAQLREVQETGGLQFEDFFPQLEKEFGLNE